MKELENNILMIIAGGIGKNIAATAVVTSIKTAKPKATIIIATAYPFVWENNPNVSLTLDLNSQHKLYVEKIKREKWTIIAHDPYHHEEYLYKKNHIIETWCHLIGIESISLKPQLFFTEKEFENAKKILPKTSKPIFVIQTSGGAPNQRFPISWARDLHIDIAQKVVNEMIKNNYEVIHLRRSDQPSLVGTTWINATPREIMALIKFSDKRLFIDSFPQHTAAALGLQSVVTWVSNDPKTFGYNIHKNLIPPTGRPEEQKNFRHYPNSYLEQFDITGAIEQYPYIEPMEKLFSAEEILKTLLS